MAGECDVTIKVDGGDGRYSVSVQSTVGEASAEFALDPGPLRSWLAQPRARARDMSAPHTQPRERAAKIGAQLHDALLGPPTAGLVMAAMRDAERAGRVPRFVLRLPPSLVDLPWELLYNGEFLALRLPIVRYLDATELVQPLHTTRPLRILGLAAQPAGLTPLDAETERHRLMEVLEPLLDNRGAAVEWLPDSSWQDIQEALSSARCDVLHFIGHGTFDAAADTGRLILGDGTTVSAQALRELLNAAHPLPRLVVLNSCWTGTGSVVHRYSSAATALAARVPAVVAMQAPIADDAAIDFAAAFYGAVAVGHAVDDAVTAGRRALAGRDRDSAEWATPVLYLRSTGRHLIAPAPTATTGWNVQITQGPGGTVINNPEGPVTVNGGGGR